MSIAMLVHLLGVVIWVGGMFFAHVVLRPVLNQQLEPQLRLPLLLQVFDRFFPWVWGSVIGILVSGYWIVFTRYESDTALWLTLMTLIGTLMAVIFVFIYTIPYHQLGRALKTGDMPRAVAAITLIRQLIATNLGLGLFVTLVAVLGRNGWIG
ncbi:MAG: CopD family protein [Candidatus Thiodiazotropha sp.]